MPIEVRWLDTGHTMICAEGTGAWTWDEYYRAIETMVEMMRPYDHRVDIINLRGANAQMPRGSAIPHFQRALSRLPAQCGLVVNVTTNPFAKVMATIFTRLQPGEIGRRVFFVASLDEARALIQRHRLGTRSAA